MKTRNLYGKTATANAGWLHAVVRHLVNYSGGVCSWAEAKRAAAKYGSENVPLLFADTYIEDDDLYRFLVESVANIYGYKITSGLLPLQIPPIHKMNERKAYLDNLSIPGLTRIADGRTPWEVMKDQKLLASTRMDACSKILKRELLDRWTKKNCDIENTVLHFGMDWLEQDRLERIRARKSPWKVEGLLAMEKPYLEKPEMLAWLEREGIAAPRLYAMGFPHNNCGGFCIKAGQAHFALLLRTMPERYAYHEAQENKLRAELKWRQTILRDARGGKVKPLSLTEFRERIEKQETFDAHEWGGCGCALPEL